jgi:hypothetical protein
METNDSEQQLQILVDFVTRSTRSDIQTIRRSTMEQLLPRSRFEKFLGAKISSSFAGMMVLLGTATTPVDRNTAEKLYGSTGEFLEWCLRRHFENPDVCETHFLKM